jgi:hypothetical protein
MPRRPPLAWRRGNHDDDFEQNKVSGLANRKDSYFSAWLAKNKVRAFPATLAFINALKHMGIKIAVFSLPRPQRC